MPRPTRPTRIRPLRVELLEDRRVLAAYVVDTELDVVDAHDNLTSLREAIATANSNPGPDEISFDFGHDGPARITLWNGALEISEALSITGDGAELLTIDARKQSRVLEIIATEGDFSLAGLTITGGVNAGPDIIFPENRPGGAIHSMSSGLFTINASVISGNRSRGDSGDGGAVFATGDVSIIGSTLNNNRTTGRYSDAGAVFSRGSIDVADSVISGNSTASVNADGGALYAFGDITLRDSVLSANRTAGHSSRGGSAFASGNFDIQNSVISENFTSGDDSEGGALATNGGAIGSNGDIKIVGSEISNNSTSGRTAPGGAMNASDDQSVVEISGSTFYSNRTTGDFSRGGVLRAQGSVLVTDARIENNRTEGTGSQGGAISTFSDFTATRSIIAGNRTESVGARGGAIAAIFGVVELAESTISGNRTEGANSLGGAIDSYSLLLDRSTISGNSTLAEGASGGAISTYGRINLSQSTITMNTAHSASGGGVFQFESGTFPSTTTITNSVLAGNVAAGPLDDFHQQSTTTISSLYSIVGSSVDIDGPTSTNNIVINAPLLGPLADNGGPTKTHALLPGSPALDAGDPNILPDPGEFDQRGAGFLRVANGDDVPEARIDIGAYESQGVPAGFPVGDYNHDGIAGASDYALWRETLGDTVTPGEGADGVADGVIDSLDYDHWRDNYGNASVPLEQIATPLEPSVTPVALTARTMAFAGFALAGEASDDDAIDAPLSRFSRSLATDANSLQDELLLLAQDQTETPRQREARTPDSGEASRVDEDRSDAPKDEPTPHEPATLASELGGFG